MREKEREEIECDGLRKGEVRERERERGGTIVANERLLKESI